MKFWLLICNLLFISIAQVAAASGGLAPESTVYVYDRDTTIWDSQDIGFTYSNCKDPKDLKYIEACGRRKKWPPGGSELTVKSAENSSMRINGKEYVYVSSRTKMSDGTYENKSGWTEASYLNDGKTAFAKDGYLYNSPGYDYARCKNSKDPACFNRRYVKKSTSVNKAKPTEVAYGEQEYVMVEYEFPDVDNHKIKRKVRGWVQKSTLSPIREAPKAAAKKDKVSEDKKDAETHSGICTDCKKPEVKKPEEAIKEAIDNMAASTQTYKDSKEFERFACIYSSAKNYPKGFSKDNFCKFFKNRKPNFKEQIKKSSEAFQLPESLVGCMVLIESAMYKDPKQKGEYLGYGQFGRSAVTDHGRRVKTEPYLSMWKKYTKRSTADFNNTNIRVKDDVEIAVGAISVYVKWLLSEQIPNSKCKDCSPNRSLPSQKDAYLTVFGYNLSPYGISQLVGMTPYQMRTQSGLRDETLAYFGKIDRCLAKNQFAKFGKDQVSGEFTDRGAKCEKPCN